jgi:ribose-phosphate pyrophosphokinase
MRASLLLAEILCFSFLLSTASAALEKAVVAVRGGEELAKQYCGQSACGRRLLVTDSKEFANGNTFVRFEDLLAGREVDIISPRVLDANQFMDLLIKIRTARSEFSPVVNVVTEQKSGIEVSIEGADGNKKNLDPNLVLRFIEKAGADQINSESINSAHEKRSPRIYRQSENMLVVDLKTNSSFALGLARELRAPRLGLSEALEFSAIHPATKVIVVGAVNKSFNASLFESLLAIAQLKTSGASVLFMTPYLPYARSDKKDQPGVAISGRLAADLIESSGADSVQFIRAHAPQSQGFFSIPSIQTSGRKTIERFLRSVGVEQVISPDAGFQKDAMLYADDLGVPVSVINKQRNPKTGEIKIHDMGGPSVQGKIVAIIDDETATGGTLAKAAELLKNLGAHKVLAVVTHLAGSAQQALESSAIDLIVVSNTFPNPPLSEKIKILDMSTEAANDLKEMLGLGPLSCSDLFRN